MLLIWLLLFSYMTRTSTSVDRLTVNQSIQDGETLVSVGRILEVGFFSPGNSTRRYLGIWYTNVSSSIVVWVANRNTSLQNNSGVLKLNEKGILELLNSTNSIIWSSSNLSSKAVNNPSAYLMDSGNFVVENGQESNEKSVLWQSFDYPGDTFLPGMKLGWNLETGLERSISSWASVDDPAMGEYAVKVNLRGYPQVFGLMGSDIKWRSIATPNDLSTLGNPGSTGVAAKIFVFNEKEVYYEYQQRDRSVFLVSKLSPSGTTPGFLWTSQKSTLQVISTGERDECYTYSICGSNSICNYDGRIQTCECLRGYVPKSPDQWNIAIWSDGCVPRNKSNCKNRYTDGFLKYTYLKLPDTSSSRFNATMNLDECRNSCLTNCSCTAYVNLNVSDGGGDSLMWFNNLADMRKFSQWGLLKLLQISRYL